MEITVYDFQIVAINRSKRDNFGDSIVYRDENGLHEIDLSACAENYSAENNTGSGNCVGERDIEKGYFLIYTSGIKTRIVFTGGLADKLFWRRLFRGDIFSWRLFRGSKRERFRQFQKMLAETKYTTYDLT